MLMMNPTPPVQPMDKDKVKEFVYRIVTDMNKDKVKEFVYKIIMDQVKKEFVHSSTGRKSAATSSGDDDTSSTEGCISEKLSICHSRSTHAATILSNDPNNGGATEHIDDILLDILVNDALESILNELKCKIKDFRRGTRNGNIILDDEVSLELKLKNRPSGEIKESWKLIKILKNLKIKTGKDVNRRADTAAQKKEKNKDNIGLQVVDLNEAPVDNDIINSDKEDNKFRFVELKEQIDDINLQMLKRRKLY